MYDGLVVLAWAAWIGMMCVWMIELLAKVL